jgi:hypothetical protein
MSRDWKLQWKEQSRSAVSTVLTLLGKNVESPSKVHYNSDTFSTQVYTSVNNQVNEN